MSHCFESALNARGRMNLKQLAKELGLSQTTVSRALNGYPEVAEATRRRVAEAAERPSDLVVAGVVGAAGLPGVWAAVSRGAIVALANTEALVCAGTLLTAAAKAAGGRLLPIDSEHNGVFEAIDGRDPSEIESVTLTASGGPFRTWSLEDMARATPAAAVAPPTWRMGAKISVDSATLMNKGLELIEAHHLFALPPETLSAVVHPQSIIHALVTFRDGAALAHLSAPDMAVPIARALGWPGRLTTRTARLDLQALGALTFEAPDPERFPALCLAREALIRGGAAPLALNAANEVAVEAFLAERIGFLEIAAVVEDAISGADALGLLAAPGSLEDVFAADAAVRRLAERGLAAHVA